MPLIAWTAEFELGLEPMDGQHRRWVEIINRLHGALMTATLLPLVLSPVDEPHDWLTGAPTAPARWDCSPSNVAA